MDCCFSTSKPEHPVRGFQRFQLNHAVFLWKIVTNQQETMFYQSLYKNTIVIMSDGLVVWNMAFLFRNIWDNPSHCLKLFKMVKTTNQVIMMSQKIVIMNNMMDATNNSNKLNRNTNNKSFNHQIFPLHLRMCHLCPYRSLSQRPTPLKRDGKAEKASGNPAKSRKNNGVLGYLTTKNHPNIVDKATS